MIITCTNSACGKNVKIDESDYTPGKTNEVDCPFCGHPIEFRVPEPETAVSESPTPSKPQKPLDKKKEPQTEQKKQNPTNSLPSEKKKDSGKKEESTKDNSTMVGCISLTILALLIAGLVWALFFGCDKDTDETEMQSVVTTYSDYQGFMDFEYPITIHLSDQVGAVDGYYNNNAYPGTLLDVKGTKTGDEYEIKLYRKNGNIMGSFTMKQSGSHLFGKYHDSKSNSDHRVELSSDASKPIAFQKDPTKQIIPEPEPTSQTSSEQKIAEQSLTPSLQERPDEQVSIPRRDTNGHQVVNLGLPSGVGWATCNLGATNFREMGTHYSWGEIAPKYEYTENSYRGQSSISVSNGTDAANYQWGGTWRMPTYEDWLELENYCSWQWKGEGYKVTGPNGSSIYLPAAGYSKGTTRFKANEQGDYWTSTPNGSNKSYEYIIKEDSHKLGSDKRHYGASIRPVTDK